MGKSRVGVHGRVPGSGKAIDHARTPGVAAEQPVEIGLLEVQVARVAAQFPIPVALYGEGSGEVVAAPDEGYAPQESIASGFLPYAFNALPIPGDEGIAAGALHFFCQFIVAQVDEGVPLVVRGGIFAQPGGLFFQSGIRKSFVEEPELCGG